MLGFYKYKNWKRITKWTLQTADTSHQQRYI